MGNIQWSRIKNSIKLYCKNAFAEQNIAILETDINEFLKEEHRDIVDIKFSVSNSIFSDEQIYCFSALIIYK